jgi:hypothetical protein
MGPTRKRDLLATSAVIAVVTCFLLVLGLYRWFPPVTIWTGTSLLVVAAAEFGFAFYVRAKIAEGEIGDARGWLHPLTVARSVTAAKASAWVGAVVLGWWVGVLAYVLWNRHVAVAVADTPGVVVAAASALALVVAGLWLQHCCKSPGEPPDGAEGLPE